METLPTVPPPSLPLQIQPTSSSFLASSVAFPSPIDFDLSPSVARITGSSTSLFLAGIYRRRSNRIPSRRVFATETTSRRFDSTPPNTPGVRATSFFTGTSSTSRQKKDGQPVVQPSLLRSPSPSVSRSSPTSFRPDRALTPPHARAPENAHGRLISFLDPPPGGHHVVHRADGSYQAKFNRPLAVSTYHKLLDASDSARPSLRRSSLGLLFHLALPRPPSGYPRQHPRLVFDEGDDSPLQFWIRHRHRAARDGEGPFNLGRALFELGRVLHGLGRTLFEMGLLATREEEDFLFAKGPGSELHVRLKDDGSSWWEATHISKAAVLQGETEVKYLVHWLGRDPNGKPWEATWEPATNCGVLLQDWEQAEEMAEVARIAKRRRGMTLSDQAYGHGSKRRK
ncbi:hypothetical protein BDY24DRAFT_405443 [Mrakia frigida]|uniref:chromo domain-containing protein n=1 Tax=Mrakia frigida TaxID=29902 RepID=UPI003FCC0F9E